MIFVEVKDKDADDVYSVLLIFNQDRCLKIAYRHTIILIYFKALKDVCQCSIKPECLWLYSYNFYKQLHMISSSFDMIKSDQKYEKNFQTL